VRGTAVLSACGL